VFVLDAFDLALLEQLQRDSSLPLRELADRVHLSTASVQRRIQKLKQNNVITDEVMVIDPEAVGQVITLIVEVHTDRTHHPDLEEMKAHFSVPEVQQCYYVTGDADFVLILTVPSMGVYKTVSDRLFHDNPNVKWFRTIVALDRVKTTQQVPLNGLDF
jgi:Lrp/AsnC family leucine-responsive transcriptional regulator